MANIYDSYIRCVTNPDLTKIIDPEKIIKKTPSQFRFMHFDELVFETRWYTMHEDLILLSQQFPNDVFIARYSDPEAFIPVPRECFRYCNGENQFMGFESAYKFSDHEYLFGAMGEETLLKLWFRVRDYLFRLDHTKESLVVGEKYYVDMLEDRYDHCIRSTVTVHAEMDNFKLSVDKITNAELFFRGYTRGSENEEWVEILPESQRQEPKK
jgi:hypothetical protein